MNLQSKKILFISASFFSYEKAITQELQKQGAEVDYYDERPSNSLISKGIIRVCRNLYRRKIKKYYQEISRKICTKKYDFFLLIKGESIPLDFLKDFRKKQPQAQMIYYVYDSVLEYPRFKKLFKYFDKNFTFEPEDAKKYRLHFRPLFFLEEYLNGNKKTALKYDLVFIGSAHTDRYFVGTRIQKEAVVMNFNTFFYYYSPGKWAFLLKRIFDPYFKSFDIRKLEFKPLSHSQVADIYCSSKIVLDINKPFQYGISARIFDALASGRKVITTNSDIVRYPFYRDQNICVIQRDRVKLPEDFFKTDFVPIEEKDFSMMSLSSWIDALFREPQDTYWV